MENNSYMNPNKQKKRYAQRRHRDRDQYTDIQGGNVNFRNRSNSRNRKYRDNSRNRQNQPATNHTFCNPPPNKQYCRPPPNTQRLEQQYNSNFSTRIAKPNEKYIPEHFPLYFNGESHLRTHLYPSESLALVGFETGRTYAIIEEDIVIESEGNPAAGPKDVWEIYSKTSYEGLSPLQKPTLIYKVDPNARYIPTPSPSRIQVGLPYDRWFDLPDEPELVVNYPFLNPLGIAANVGVVWNNWRGFKPARVYGTLTKDNQVEKWLQDLYNTNQGDPVFYAKGAKRLRNIATYSYSSSVQSGDCCTEINFKELAKQHKEQKEKEGIDQILSRRVSTSTVSTQTEVTPELDILSDGRDPINKVEQWNLRRNADLELVLEQSWLDDISKQEEQGTTEHNSETGTSTNSTGITVVHRSEVGGREGIIATGDDSIHREASAESGETSCAAEHTPPQPTSPLADLLKIGNLATYILGLTNYIAILTQKIVELKTHHIADKQE